MPNQESEKTKLEKKRAKLERKLEKLEAVSLWEWKKGKEITTTLIDAICVAEVCPVEIGEKILINLGFDSEQFGAEVKALELSCGEWIIDTDGSGITQGFVSAGHAGEPEYSEELTWLLLPWDEEESRYAEAVIRLGRLDFDGFYGFSADDAPWEIHAVRYAAALDSSADAPTGLLWRCYSIGDSWESGKMLYFGDGSLYYADGDRSEVWKDASDSDAIYPERRKQARRVRPSYWGF